MEYMDFSQVFLLAFVQGVTEFLPVSSSAHLVLASQFFGYTLHSVSIDIVLHGATLVAVVMYFFRDIRHFVSGFFSGNRVYPLALLFATIPIAVVGWFLYDVFEPFRSPLSVATAFILSGLLLLGIDLLVRRGLFQRWSGFPLRYRGFAVGVFQVFALLPGVSRSGITIAAGRLFGFSRREASRFSFLLSIPVIFGALLVLLFRTPFSEAFAGVSFLMLAVGAVTSFLVALVAIHFFLKLIERIGFIPFFAYQVVVGSLLFFS